MLAKAPPGLDLLIERPAYPVALGLHCFFPLDQLPHIRAKAPLPFPLDAIQIIERPTKRLHQLASFAFTDVCLVKPEQNLAELALLLPDSRQFLTNLAKAFFCCPKGRRIRPSSNT